MVVGVVEAGQIYFVRTDHIGRPIFATDAGGTKVWEASYLPFGGVQTSTGANSTLRFPGQWFQSETGLHQNWMRDYDPTLGRYIQADPLGLVAGQNVYNYALQNPGRYIDPDGRNPAVLACTGPQALGCAIGGAAIGLGYYLYNHGDAVAEVCEMLIDDLFQPPLISPASKPPTPDDEPGPNADGTYTVTSPAGNLKTNTSTGTPQPGPPGPRPPTVAGVVMEIIRVILRAGD